MKTKLLLLTVIMAVLVCFSLYGARANMPVGKSLDKKLQKSIPQNREIDYSFGINPTSLLVSYYDYMQGGYHSLPMRVQSPENGGGIYIAYHAKRAANGTRRVFYTYLNSSGEIMNNNEITSTQVQEGYVSTDLDEQSGKPFFVWHANSDTEALDEVRLSWDAYLDNIPGLINDPSTCIDNPVTLTTNQTTDNEFVWPVVQVGPSPVAGMRRVHVMAYNYAEHTGGSATENAYFAYADFNAEMLETGATLTWSYSSIPEQDAWNVDTVNWRRGFYHFVAGQNGKLYLIGYHVAFDANDNSIDENTMECFINDNYGESVWRKVSVLPDIPSWNPPTLSGTGPGYFKDEDTDVPYTDAELWWGPTEGSHSNAVIDNNGVIHLPVLYGLNNIGDTYFTNLQYMRDVQFDTDTETFDTSEIYPQGVNPHDDSPYTPWDTNEDHVVDEFYDTGEPMMQTDWSFIHWDDTAMEAKMTFHCNHVKVSEANAQGMMACVWGDSWRAKQFNQYSDEDYAAFADVPEIYISVSPDNGYTWSEPIVLNSVEVPEFAGEKPTFAYPADKIIYTGTDPQGHKQGRLYLTYFDDNSWGPYASQPGIGANDGGNVKYMALDITFPLSTATNDQVTIDVPMTLAQNYPNPFNPETSIKFNLPKAGSVSVQIFNLKGQLVKTLVDTHKSAGDHEVKWNGTDSNGKNVSTGVYYYTLSDGKTKATRKMILMK